MSEREIRKTEDGRAAGEVEMSLGSERNCQSSGGNR